MKIICVGRNYADHAKELKNEVPTEPVIFMKPETAILPKRNPFFIPDFTNDVHYEAELVVRINKIGKNIQEKFAYKYYDEVTLGIDFTARDLQQKLKEKGLPWEKAKAFDGSAAVGKFVKLSDVGDLNQAEFTLDKNEIRCQTGYPKDMIFPINKLIEYVSQYFTLKIGDLIFTGTPAGVGAVAKDDTLQLMLNNQTLLKLNVK
ncbi:fumarylacetoacetate hydrolase family protein [Owenweeksia hongkongensis]|uniref:2-keto-4-pentenoate hydratase/2-oxohepta-3-ene-1,7-dioic acid hydratase n=1 Tax=Owenweeksia hongkongensis (strain DSM 17368 / CIP 108786 / JCM 12287 / NRRL B-23963 / UST20020801) TaxID=926562 RepID=G8R3X6_OWEHD|nr:fumarylacetoacetate hydrolase family protein [Owenweeksia hongkongensis]AEV32008.1 2-keto-4-pentenoate hydratase/2-oxohepta-3-ene-1,7-dioic acid hydratase [Owenweeksia hongkongensis DSM 17368]